MEAAPPADPGTERPATATQRGSHHHHHHPTAAGRERGRLLLVMAVTGTILAAEVVGGILAHSLVLIADAGHMATDAAGIGLSLVAVWFAGRPSSETRTFGFQRAEILTAVVNAMALLAVGVFILVEAGRRLSHPPSPTASLMVGFGIVALAGNGASVALLTRGQGASITIRGAFLEVLSDMLGAAAILVVAAVVAATGFRAADPLASIVIGLLILPRAVNLLREAVDVLLEAAPRHVNLVEVRDHIRATPGVIDVHDLHAWTITSGQPVLSAHVVVSDETLADGGGARVLDQLGDCLAGHFDVDHCTFQLEPLSHQAHERHLHP